MTPDCAPSAGAGTRRVVRHGRVTAHLGGKALGILYGMGLELPDDAR